MQGIAGTFTEWSCIRRGAQILVYEGESYKGSYNLIAEPYCKICAHTDVDTESCTDHTDLDGFERIYAMGKFASDYYDTLSYHIYAFKKYPVFANPLGKGLIVVVKELYPELLDSTMIVPIPQHPEKTAERGFDQALELSKVVGYGLNKPVAEVLGKVQNIEFRPLGRDERRAAAETAYVGLEKCSEVVNGKRVLIVDDVVTTCSTSAKCARLLKEAGATSVNVLVAGKSG